MIAGEIAMAFISNKSGKSARQKFEERVRQGMELKEKRLEVERIQRSKEANVKSFLIAACKGNVEILSEYLKKIDVNATDDKGQTALMCAASYGRNDALRFLLDNGADRNMKDKDGWTAMKWAYEYGHGETLAFLSTYRKK